MPLAVETNATPPQSRFGGQQGACSHGGAGEMPVVVARQMDRQTDTHTDAVNHNTFTR